MSRIAIRAAGTASCASRSPGSSRSASCSAWTGGSISVALILFGLVRVRVFAGLARLLLDGRAVLQRPQHAARPRDDFDARLQAARDLYVGLARDAGLDLYELGLVALQDIDALDVLRLLAIGGGFGCAALRRRAGRRRRRGLLDDGLQGHGHDVLFGLGGDDRGR